MATAPKFIDTDIQPIIDGLVQSYSDLTGRVIHPAQVEQLLINVFSYREGLVREQIQEAAEQNLVAFSRAPVLDYLGELVGVKRIAALPASCEIEFNVTSNVGGIYIPAGTRVGSSDGIVAFSTDEAITLLPGNLTGSTTATCITPGIVGNGYTASMIKNILDPLAFVATAANTNTTAGGAEQESDDHLRERIKLAPSSFSNAGSKGAYTYWAKTANPEIIDVGITSTTPGYVEIYPLMSDGGVTPPQVLDAVEAICSADKVRPLTDTVFVYSPTRIDYHVVVNATVYEDADADVAKSAIEANLEAFGLRKRQKLGQDIVLNAVEKECMVDGVYDVELEDGLSNPFATIVVAETEFAYMASYTVNIVGTTAG